MNKELSTALTIFAMWLFWIVFLTIACSLSKYGIKLDLDVFLRMSGASTIVTFIIMILAYSDNDAGETK